MKAIWNKTEFDKIASVFEDCKQKYAIAVCDVDFLLRFCKRFTASEIDSIMSNIYSFFFQEVEGKGFLLQSNHDEFLIAVKDCSKQQLFQLINDARLKFRRQRFARNCNGPLSNIAMTFSSGIACSPDDDSLFSEVFKEAVTALFLAKARRRNCVAFYPENAPPSGLKGNGLSVQIELGRFGECGFVEKKVLAKDALLWEPQAIEADDSGNLFILDQNNHCLLKYDGENVVRVAGSGRYGYSGDGGSALEAAFNKPTGLTVFKNAVYITDTGNDAVRKLDLLTGRLETIAGNSAAGYSGDGGSAKCASLNKPGGVAVDNDENIYINDIANNVIRKVDSSGTITTFAGTGGYGYSGDFGPAANATFAEIYAISLSRVRGELYLADYYNHCVRKICLKTGIISTIAGSGKPGYDGDGSDFPHTMFDRPVAICSDDSAIYVADSGNSCIRCLNIEKNLVYTVAGDGFCGTGKAGKAQDFRFANPNGLAIGPKGILYILDGANNRVCSVKIKEDYYEQQHNL
jgi:GGDEF domain-containing protein